MRKTSVLLVLLILAVTINAQQKNGIIKGYIQTEDNKPAASVTVRLAEIKKSAITNSNGKFTFNQLPPGSYTLEVSFVGYDTLQTEISVSADSTAEINLQLKLSRSELREVIISAARHQYTTNKASQSLRLNQELIEVPQNIAVTTKETFKDLGAVSSSEIMRTASGIRALGSKQDIGLNVRGTNSYYSILRNGVGAGYWYNMEVDPGMLERAEFIKGPAGYMVSNTEPGGLANFVTKQPTHERIASAGIVFGSWNMIRTTVDFGGEFKKDGALTYRLNAGYQQQQENYDFGYLKKYYIAAALKYEVNQNTDLTLEYNHIHGHQLSNGQSLQTVNGKRVLPNSFAVVDPNVDGTVSADHYFRFHAKHKLNSTWTLNTQAAYVFGPWGGYNMGLDYTPISNDTLYRWAWRTDWRNKLFTAHAFLDGTFYTGAIEHKLMAGIDYGNNQAYSGGGGSGSSSLALNIANPVYFLPKDTLKNFDTKQWESRWGNYYSALYLQYNIKIFDKLIGTFAGRYTQNVTWSNYDNPNVQTDKRFTPRLGLTYLFTKDISLYALYDQAFLPQSGRSFTGKQFKPLTGDNREIGIKTFWFDKKLSANITVYQIIKNNALTTDPQHPGFQVQSGRITSKGFEFDINGNITPQLNIIANYAYTLARITDSNDSTQVGLDVYGSARNLANIFTKYRFANGLLRGFAIGAGAQYTGPSSYASDVKDMGRDRMKAYTLYEASVGYYRSKFYVNLNIFNLTNRKYITNVYGLNNGIDYVYTPGQATNFRMDFGINF